MGLALKLRAMFRLVELEIMALATLGGGLSLDTIDIDVVPNESQRTASNLVTGKCLSFRLFTTDY